MKAKSLQQIDEEYVIHLAAWKNQEVQATKKRGKKSVPVYERFNQFFDYQKRIDEVSKPIKKEKELSRFEQLMLQANS